MGMGYRVQVLRLYFSLFIAFLLVVIIISLFEYIIISTPPTKPRFKQPVHNITTVDTERDTELVKVDTERVKVGRDRDIEKVKAVIVYLASDKRLPSLVESVKAPFEHFNDRFAYPLLILHFGDLNVSHVHTQFAKTLTQKQNSLIDIRRAVGGRLFPPGFDTDKALRDGVVYPFFYPNYNHMCAFWIHEIFRQPYFLEHDIEYYLRLDTDSRFWQPITYDLFRYMKTHNLAYGFRAKPHEDKCCSNNLAAFIYQYIKSNESNNRLSSESSEHNQTISTESTIKLSSEMDWILNLTDPALSTPLPQQMYMYYNNLEVVNVKQFRDDASVWRWLEHVWLQGAEGIYRHRWGDALVRYYTVHMSPQLHSRLVRFCDLDYQHAGFHFLPRCSHSQTPDPGTHAPYPKEIPW